MSKQEQNSPEPKVKVLIPMYEPLEVSKCEKCDNIIAEREELIITHIGVKIERTCCRQSKDFIF